MFSLRVIKGGGRCFASMLCRLVELSGRGCLTGLFLPQEQFQRGTRLRAAVYGLGSLIILVDIVGGGVLIGVLIMLG